MRPSWTKEVRTPISWVPQAASAAGVTVQVTVALSPGARERIRVLPAGSADQPSGRSRRVLTWVTAVVPVLVTVDVISVPSPPACRVGRYGVSRTRADGQSRAAPRVARSTASANAFIPASLGCRWSPESNAAA